MDSEARTGMMQHLLAAAEVFGYFMDVAVAERQRALNAGFSETAAEQMALQAYSVLMTSAASGAAQPPPG